MLELIDKLERFYGPLPAPPDEPFVHYVWQVLGARTTAMRRDAAMAALRKIPALTPDSMGRTPRAQLQHAIALAGPFREERFRALTSGIDVFKRHHDLPQKLRGDLDGAREGLSLLPYFTAVASGWLLLFAGRHPRFPDDPDVLRVFARLQEDADAAAEQLGGVLTAVQRAALYLAHHGRSTCADANPLCHICPLRSKCASARPS
jgi:endonuclease III